MSEHKYKDEILTRIELNSSKAKILLVLLKFTKFRLTQMFALATHYAYEKQNSNNKFELFKFKKENFPHR